jgi:hypothetical protein
LNFKDKADCKPKFKLIATSSKDVLDIVPWHPASVELAEACFPYFTESPAYLDILLAVS